MISDIFVLFLCDDGYSCRRSFLFAACSQCISFNSMRFAPYFVSCPGSVQAECTEKGGKIFTHCTLDGELINSQIDKICCCESKKEGGAKTKAIQKTKKHILIFGEQAKGWNVDDWWEKERIKERDVNERATDWFDGAYAGCQLQNFSTLMNMFYNVCTFFSSNEFHSFASNSYNTIDRQIS